MFSQFLYVAIEGGEGVRVCHMSMAPKKRAQNKTEEGREEEEISRSAAVAHLPFLPLQGCTKRNFPGCVKLDEKLAFCLPTVSRRIQLSNTYSHNPGELFWYFLCSPAQRQGRRRRTTLSPPLRSALL